MNTFTLMLMICLILVTISTIMKSSKNKAQREKLSAFECGFEPEHKMRNSFSLRFFTLTVVFLIFDVEVAILFPLPLSNESLMFSYTMVQGVMIFMLLSGGLIFEWLQGALEWRWTII